MNQSQPEPMSLHRKLTEVMASVDWQKKTGTNTQQNYKFVTAESIKDAVRGHLAQRGVMVYTSVKSVDRSEWQTKSGTTMFSAIIHGEVTFADGDSGEMFTVEAAGEGMDSGDKALNKAMTAMVKYALINTFLIPTGDDPEQDSPEVTQRAQRPVERPRTPVAAVLPVSAPSEAVSDLTDFEWQELIGDSPPAKPTSIAPGLNSRDFFDRTKAAGLESSDVTRTAKKMFGANKWKVVDLSDEERALLWQELEAVPA